MCHWLFRQVTGKEKYRFSGTPYEPSEATPMETQVPSGVPRIQSWKWLQIAPATDSAGVRFLACEQSAWPHEIR